MEEKHKKIDRRVIKTKRAIRNAFVKLMVEKEVEKITIKEIAETADVDRKTIYNYYTGVYDIWDDLENELLSDFEKATHDLKFDVEHPLAVFEALTQLISDNMEVYTLLMRIKPDPRISGKLYSYLRAKVSETINTSKRIKLEREHLATEFVTGALFCSYQYWFQTGQKEPLEEFTKNLGDMIVNGVSAYLIRE